MKRRRGEAAKLLTEMRMTTALLGGFDRIPRPPLAIPAGYVLVRADELNALLREAVMTARLAAIAAATPERALVDGLLPTLRYAVQQLARTPDEAPLPSDDSPLTPPSDRGPHA